MSNYSKLLAVLLSGRSDANISFIELCGFLEHLGFAQRVRGDHHIFSKNGIEEIINIQPNGSKAKPYQVRQIRNAIIKYKLSGKV